MKTFRVMRKVDAYVNYIADVEAETAQQATILADKHEEKYNWEEDGVSEFDARIFVTLGDEDEEIPETEIEG